MANEEINTKTYELAYHLNPSIEEAKVATSAQEILDVIAQNGGSVLNSLAPRRTHLSYPIGRNQYGYFGIVNFTAPAETVEKLNAAMKLQNNLLRYLFLAKPREGKELRTLGEYRARSRIRTHEPSAAQKQEKAKPSPKPTEAGVKEMEEEIEKVIEGL